LDTVKKDKMLLSLNARVLILQTKLDYRERLYGIESNFLPMLLFKPTTNATRSQDKRQLS